MSATEQDYDESIAPLLLQVANRCKELGMTMVARVEWQPDCGGITQVVPSTASVTQKLMQLAAHAGGNIDLLCIEALRRFDCSGSIILRAFSDKRG